MPNRFDGIADIFRGVADMVGLGGYWWGPGAVAVVVVGGLSPLILKNQRTSRARRLLQRAYATTDPKERDALEAEALGEVAGNAVGLVIVGDIALQRGRLETVREVAKQLRATGKEVHELRRLERALEGDNPRTIDDAVIRIERAIRLGMVGEAHERWAWAHAKWPEDEEIAALETKLPAR